MSAIHSFEDIQAWKKARELTKVVYKVSSAGAFARDHALRDQIRRAAISISSNIAEGFERSGDREFRHFLSIAQASAAEVRSQIYLALDIEYITTSEFHLLHRLATDTYKLTGGFIHYLEANPKPRR